MKYRARTLTCALTALGLTLFATSAISQQPMPSSPDQGGDGIVVIDSSSAHKPIAWGASDAFKLSRDLRRRPGPDVQLDASLTQRNRQARDRSLMLAHERLIQRTQFAGREAPGESSVGQ